MREGVSEGGGRDALFAADAQQKPAVGRELQHIHLMVVLTEPAQEPFPVRPVHRPDTDVDQARPSGQRLPFRRE